MRRIYRSEKNGLIGGVAAGLAEYFEVDIALVRLLWLASVLLAGTGVLAYIVAWIVIPPESQVTAGPGDAEGFVTGETSSGGNAGDAKKLQERRRRGGGLLLIGLGIFLLAREVLPGDFFHYLWPLLLVVLGAYLLINRKGPVE